MLICIIVNEVGIIKKLIYEAFVLELKFGFTWDRTKHESGLADHEKVHVE